jgi:hypothetical protein
MTQRTDQEFAAEVAALEKELRDGSTATNEELAILNTKLDKDFAAADKALMEFAEEVEKEIVEETETGPAGETA